MGETKKAKPKRFGRQSYLNADSKLDKIGSNSSNPAKALKMNAAIPAVLPPELSRPSRPAAEATTGAVERPARWVIE